MPITINDLPNEILSQIVEFFSIDSSPQRTDDRRIPLIELDNIEDWKHSATRALCLTSRRLHEIAEPIHYESYFAGQTDHTPGVPRWMNQNLPCFIRTLLERPDLRPRLKNVFLWDWKRTVTLTDPLSSGKETPFLGEAARHVCSDISQLMRIEAEPLQVIWDNHVKEPCEDAAITILLYLASNLSLLHFGQCELMHPRRTSGVEAFTFYHRLLRRSMDDYLKSRWGMHKFESLKNISLDGHNSARLTVEMGEFMRLPNIETLSIRNGLAVYKSEWSHGWKCPPRSSNVKHLALDNSGITEECLAVMLNSCRELHSFEWDASTDFEHNSHYAWYGVFKALAPHRLTLEHLMLRMPLSLDVIQGPLEHHLPDFTRLKSLSMRGRMLFEMIIDTPSIKDCLPRCLEHLRIFHGDDLLITTLEELQRAAANGAFPDLTLLQVERYDDEEDGDDEYTYAQLEEDLTSSFEALGTHVTWKTIIPSDVSDLEEVSEEDSLDDSDDSEDDQWESAESDEDYWDFSPSAQVPSDIQ